MALPDLDPIDLRIAGLLQENGRIPQAEIARAVGLAPSAVLERVRKLESRGVIRGYATHLSPGSVGLSQLAFVAVRTSAIGHQESDLAVTLGQLPEVLEVHHVAGEDCFLLKVRARDAQHLGELLRRNLGTIPGVISTRTTVVLETFKETCQLPLPVVPRQSLGQTTEAERRPSIEPGGSMETESSGIASEVDQ